jgi:outer membrane protein OmpA-like peptidoglycan-associated protein
MTMSNKRLLSTVGLCVLLVSAAAPAESQSPQAPASSVTGRSIKAIGYSVGGGGTTVDLKSSGLVPAATGEAKVEAKGSVTTIEVKARGLALPTPIGTEFLSYVVWAVSPEGRAVNLGEIRPDKNGGGSLKVTTQLQSFSLFVTAEPYPFVRLPSEMLVLENDVRKNTKGRLFIVEDYPLMKRNQYQVRENPLSLSLDLKNVPLEMYQARNAVEIARTQGAGKYAPEIFSKAEGGLELAENALTRKTKDVVSLARQTAQSSEDARSLTVERKEQERIAAEKAAAAAKAKAEAEAKAAAEAAAAKQRADAEAAAAKQRTDAEARRQAELAAAREAQLRAEAAAREAEAARQEAQLRAEAAARDAAAREAQLQTEQAKAETERARKAAEALRAQLLEQFNRIMETRDSPRGLVVTMADVLFDTGKYDLRPPTREALARLSGIALAHPGLRFEVEGHTDSTGSDELNQTLSQQRADTVRGYLVQQGLPAQSVTASGFGKTAPVADNGTAAGRQKNRRVELIVSGDIIGMQIGK